MACARWCSAKLRARRSCSADRIRTRSCRRGGDTVDLADAAIWIDHLRRSDQTLVDLLSADRIVMHPLVRDEIALGSIADRTRTLGVLDDLPHLRVVAAAHVTLLIERARLWNCGIGYVDAHLLAAAALTQGALLWTRDKRLRVQAEELNVAYPG